MPRAWIIFFLSIFIFCNLLAAFLSKNMSLRISRRAWWDPTSHTSTNAQGAVIRLKCDSPQGKGKSIIRVLCSRCGLEGASPFGWVAIRLRSLPLSGSGGKSAHRDQKLHGCVLSSSLMAVEHLGQGMGVGGNELHDLTSPKLDSP